MTRHARRWLTPRVSEAWATAVRLAAGFTIFCADLLEDCVVQHRLGQQLLQPPVLILQHLRPARIRHIEPAVLRLPLVERRAADPVLAAHIRRLRPRLLLPQDRDNLLFREPAPLHRPCPPIDGLYPIPEGFHGLRSNVQLMAANELLKLAVGVATSPATPADPAAVRPSPACGGMIARFGASQVISGRMEISVATRVSGAQLAQRRSSICATRSRCRSMLDRVTVFGAREEPSGKSRPRFDLSMLSAMTTLLQGSNRGAVALRSSAAKRPPVAGHP